MFFVTSNLLIFRDTRKYSKPFLWTFLWTHSKSETWVFRISQLAFSAPRNIRIVISFSNMARFTAILMRCCSPIFCFWSVGQPCPSPYRANGSVPKHCHARLTLSASLRSMPLSFSRPPFWQHRGRSSWHARSRLSIWNFPFRWLRTFLCPEGWQYWILCCPCSPSRLPVPVPPYRLSRCQVQHCAVAFPRSQLAVFLFSFGFVRFSDGSIPFGLGLLGAFG